MAEYRIETNGQEVTIWNESEGIGIRFRQGDTLQGYNSSIVIQDTSKLSTAEGQAKVTGIQNDLTRFAKLHYPKEFVDIKE